MDADDGGEARIGRADGSRPSVLIVDDDFLIAEYLREVVEDAGCRVCATAATAEDAVAEALRFRPDVVLMDVRLRGAGDGVDAALRIHARLGTPVVFITGSNEPETMRRIQADHPRGILVKPILPEQLVASLRDVIAEEDEAG